MLITLRYENCCPHFLDEETGPIFSTDFLPIQSITKPCWNTLSLPWVLVFPVLLGKLGAFHSLFPRCSCPPNTLHSQMCVKDSQVSWHHCKLKISKPTELAFPWKLPIYLNFFCVCVSHLPKTESYILHFTQRGLFTNSWMYLVLPTPAHAVPSLTLH